MKRASRPFRYLFVLAFLAGQSLCVGFGPPTLAARDFDPAPLWPQQVRQLSRVAPPSPEATAALLLDVATQTPLYEKNAGQRCAPASTTKMMTALVALERGHLSDSVVVQAGDLAVDSLLGLGAGEVWALEDLLYALLLPSDNAAALVIARHIAGSEAAFVALMNERAAHWGLRNTHFANPHGYDDPQHYSTAHDLAQVALRGLANPVFATMVATRQRRVGRRTLVNLNQLLGAYEGAEGIKTGTTDQAGQCLISLARRPDGRALCIVLGSADRYRDSRLLLDYYFATYRTVSLKLGPKGLNRIRTLDGREAVLVLGEHPQVLLLCWQLPSLRVQRLSRAVGAPDTDGSVGSARFTLGTVLLAEVPLYASPP